MLAFLFLAATSSSALIPPSQTIQLRPEQLLAIAESAQSRGDVQTAAAAYEALSHDRDADIRNEARFRRAKLLMVQGKMTEAALLLRQILDEKPAAAPVRLELAGVLDKLGDKEGAWRQIRAVQAGGLPPAVRRLVDRYSEALRAQRPFGASFEIAIAPDSNINHATSRDELGTVLGDFQIADDSKAKSGTGLALSGQAYRRFGLSGDGRQLLLRFGGVGNLYKKSRFDDFTADLGIGPELDLGSSRLNLEAGITQRWYGQKPYMRSARLGFSAQRQIGRTTQLRLVGTAALVDNRINSLEDGKDYSGELSVEHALSPTTGVSITTSALRESLDDPAYSTTSWRFGLLGWRDIGRITITATGQMGRLRADERLSLFPDKRSDRYLRLDLGATFRQIQWHSFAPVFRFSFERNRSTIAFYDYRRTRTEIGIVHAF